MSKKNTIPIRADPRFKSELEDMKLKRMFRGKESKTSRLTLAMTRHPAFKKIKMDIIDADLV